MFVIYDSNHADYHGEYNNIDQALHELERRAEIPWNEPPNRTPCSSWATCSRDYEVLEVDDTNLPWEELQRFRVLEVSPDGVQWASDFSSSFTK